MQTGYLALWDPLSAVIFDFDDTLALTMKTRWSALIVTARAFDWEINGEMIEASWGKPFGELIGDLLPAVNLHAFVEVYKQTMREFPPSAAPGAVALLEYLHRRHMRIDILTSSSRDLVRQDLESLRLTRYVDGIWGFEETSPHFKPSAEVLQPVLSALYSQGLQRSMIVYVGDSLKDWEVARANQLKFIAVTSGLEGEDAFRSHGLPQECIVGSLEELVPA